MAEDYGQKRTEDAIRKFVEQSHAERLSALAGAKELGLHSIKALVALNGGAMLAQLTFVAALFGKEAAQGTRMTACDRLSQAQRQRLEGPGGEARRRSPWRSTAGLHKQTCQPARNR